MSQSATPATQNDMTTSLETFEKERFCGFLHRHSEATGKPETRDETRGSTKTILSCETSGDFHNWQHNKRTGFAASPIDTAKPREHQILETRYVLRTKTSISYETSSTFHTLPASKSTFSYEFSLEPENLQPQNRCFVRGFRQFSAHAQNATPATEFAPCHHLTQPCQCDLQKTRNTRLKCCACHEKWRWTRPRKLQHIFWKRHKSIAPATQNDFRHVPEHVWMSRSATPANAKRSNDTSATPKKDHLCRTSHRHGHTGIARTVADGCARERNVERTHPQPPDPQSETGTLATHLGKRRTHPSRVWKLRMCLQTKIFNNIAVNLHAWISNTSVHATFACISLTNIRKSPSCNISKNNIPHELWLLNVLFAIEHSRNVCRHRTKNI